LEPGVTNLPAATSQSTVAVDPTNAANLAGDSFDTYDEAERLVGYSLLRPDFALAGVTERTSGIIEVCPETGLPRARQIFAMPGHETALHFAQEPATYPISRNYPGTLSTEVFGSFEGTLGRYKDEISFQFETGASVNGVAIRALVVGNDHSVEDLRRFVESLSFGSR
jgi:hypothetical protein